MDKKYIPFYEKEKEILKSIIEKNWQDTEIYFGYGFLKIEKDTLTYRLVEYNRYKDIDKIINLYMPVIRGLAKDLLYKHIIKINKNAGYTAINIPTYDELYRRALSK